MNELEKKIKQKNREIKLKKCTDKILFPFKKLKETNQNLCEAVKEYIEKRKEIRRQNILEKERERLFQNDCQKRYEEYINAYNPDRVGEKDYFETENDFNEALKNSTPVQIQKTIYYGELGNTVKTHYIYPSTCRPVIKTEYEGIIKDESGKFGYVLTSEEMDHYLARPKNLTVIKRKPNGKFVNDKDASHLGFLLKCKFEDCEQDYRNKERCQ